MRYIAKPGEQGIPNDPFKPVSPGFGRLSAAAYLAMIHGAGSRPGPARTNQRATTEEDLHIACADWVFKMESVYPILEFMFHTPNGGARSKRTCGRLKAMGTRKGVPDWMLPLRHGSYAGLAIEMKAPGRGMTDEQRAWLDSLSSGGYLTGIACSIEDFQKLVLRFLNSPSARSA